jgi:hypothetical protein
MMYDVHLLSGKQSYSQENFKPFFTLFTARRNTFSLKFQFQEVARTWRFPKLMVALFQGDLTTMIDKLKVVFVVICVGLPRF